MDDKTFNQLFELRFASKQLQKASTKAEKKSEQTKKQVAQYLQKGNVEAARLYAENAIRHKNEALHYLRLSAKLDGMRSRLEHMAANVQVAKQMGAITQGLQKFSKELDLNALTQVLDKFEHTMEDSEVISGVIEHAMEQATLSSTPVDQVDALIQQVADDYTLNLATLMPGVSLVTGTAEAQQESKSASKSQAKKAVAL